MAYPVYNPNPMLGQAHVYPHLQLPFPPQPHHVPVRQWQAVAHQRQPQLPWPAPNTRTRATLAEEQKNGKLIKNVKQRPISKLTQLSELVWLNKLELE
jgi:hypothetical protein